MFSVGQSRRISTRARSITFEDLETRRLLSAAPAFAHAETAKSGSAITQPQAGSGSNQSGVVVLFSAAPAAVQTGLQTLVGSTTIPANQRVHENVLPGGTEIYCIKLVSAGTSTIYAVNSTGAAVPVPPPPQQGSSQGGSSGSTGSTGMPVDTVVLFSAAPAAIQTGLRTLVGSSTIPTNQKVHENTLPDGTTIYVIKLTASGTSTLYAVDSTGAAVPVPQPAPPPPQQGDSAGNSGGAGNSGSTGGTGSGGSTGTTATSGNTGSTGGGTGEGDDTVVLFSAAPAAVRTGLQMLVGSTTIPSNQPVHENTLSDGTTIYVVKLTTNGSSTLYAVDSTGAAVAVPPPPAPPQSGASGGSQSGSQQGSTGDQQQGEPTHGSGAGTQQGMPPSPPQQGSGTSTGTQGGNQPMPPPPPPQGSSPGATGGTGNS